MRVIVERHASSHHHQHQSIPICQRWMWATVCHHICTAHRATFIAEPLPLILSTKRFHQCITHRMHMLAIRRPPLISTMICTMVIAVVAKAQQISAMIYQRWKCPEMFTMSTLTMVSMRINTTTVNIPHTLIAKRNSILVRVLRMQAVTFAYQMVICTTITADSQTRV